MRYETADKIVDISGRADITEIFAPKATIVGCQGCTKLTEIFAPKATIVGCQGCTKLTEIFAPKVTAVNFDGCTKLKRINDEILVKGKEAAARIAEVAKHALATPDALNMEEWHTCATTHCIAGWGIHLAGERGRELEKRYSSVAAGAILLGTEALSHFFDSNEDARKWLETKLAA